MIIIFWDSRQRKWSCRWISKNDEHYSFFHVGCPSARPVFEIQNACQHVAMTRRPTWSSKSKTSKWRLTKYRAVGWKFSRSTVSRVKKHFPYLGFIIHLLPWHHFLPQEVTIEPLRMYQCGCTYTRRMEVFRFQRHSVVSCEWKNTVLLGFTIHPLRWHHLPPEMTIEPLGMSCTVWLFQKRTPRCYEILSKDSDRKRKEPSTRYHLPIGITKSKRCGTPTIHSYKYVRDPSSANIEFLVRLFYNSIFFKHQQCFMFNFKKNYALQYPLQPYYPTST